MSVTKTNLFSLAVTPINKSNSSCIGFPIFLSLTFSLAYSFMQPKIGITESPFTNASTALCDFFGFMLFSAPYRNSSTVISEIKQFSLPFSFIIESKFIFLVGDNGELLDEMRTFPKGQHDDVLDSLSMQLSFARTPFIPKPPLRDEDSVEKNIAI